MDPFFICIHNSRIITLLHSRQQVECPTIVEFSLFSPLRNYTHPPAIMHESLGKKNLITLTNSHYSIVESNCTISTLSLSLSTFSSYILHLDKKISNMMILVVWFSLFNSLVREQRTDGQVDPIRNDDYLQTQEDRISQGFVYILIEIFTLWETWS